MKKNKLAMYCFINVNAFIGMQSKSRAYSRYKP